MTLREYKYKFPMAACTSDIVVLKRKWILNAYPNKSRFEYSVLLIQRSPTAQAFPSEWALPGGFVNVETETFKQAAVRELQEETGLCTTEDCLSFVGIYDEVKRDPRQRTITCAYLAQLLSEPNIVAADDAVDFKWVDVMGNARHILAFDHKKIICDALKKIGVEYNDF